MFITILCLFYQHNAKNAQKRKWLFRNERKYADESKANKLGIDALFLLFMLDFTFNSSTAINIRGLLSAWLTFLHPSIALHDKWRFFCIPSS